MSDQTAKTAVCVSFVVMIVMNGISSAGLFGMDIKSISDAFPTYITPDGRTFAVWGVIYALHLAMVVTQCIADPLTEQLLSQRCQITGLELRWRIVIAFLLNAVWLPVYTSLRIALALLIIVCYLGALLSAYVHLTPKATVTWRHTLVLSAPLAANASWLVVATCANLFTVLGTAGGWRSDLGVAGSPEAAAVLVALVSFLACAVALLANDIAWPAVACWALVGLRRMHTVPDPVRLPLAAMSPLVATAATAGAVLCALAAVKAAWSAGQPEPPRAQLLPMMA